MKRAVFIERDGVLTETVMQGTRQVKPENLQAFTLRSGLEQVLLPLKKADFLILVTTNQPAVSEGILTRRDLNAMHVKLREAIPCIDDIFICPHTDHDHCPCRAPRPGLLIEAAFKWHINLDRSFVVSDKGADAEAGRTAGCLSLLIKSPLNGEGRRDGVVPDLQSVVQRILEIRS